MSRDIEDLCEKFAGLIESFAGEGALGTVPTAAAVDAAGAVERLSRLTEHAQVVLAGVIDEERDRAIGSPPVAQQYGCRNTVELLQRVTRAPARVLTKRLKLAKRVVARVGISGEIVEPPVPLVAAAFSAGELSTECASMIAGTLESTEHVAAPESLEIAERELVAAATGDDMRLPEHADNMRTICQVWKSFLDQDGAEPLEVAPEERRGIRLGRARDGLVRISGYLLPEAAASLGRLLDALNAPSAERRRVRFEAADGSQEVARDQAERDQAERDSIERDAAGDGAASAGAVGAGAAGADIVDGQAPAALDGRTPEQRRHDALAAVLTFAMRSPEVPQLGGAPVTVLLQADVNDLNARRGTAWVQGFDGQLAPVPLNSVRHAACSGAVQRVLRDHTGRIVELGTTQRVFNAHQRRAITLRDAGCIIPGCTVPATWCEIHHVQEHANGGPTHTDNGVLLCWYHHRSLDTSGWEIRMACGVPEVRPPTWLDRHRRWYRTGSPLRAPSLRRTG
ncbi:MAG: DUF222 domain-containing protein [Leucobacter sp.]